MKKFEEKKHIENIIESGDYIQAWEKLFQYKLKYENDVNFYSLAGLIYILEGKLDRASSVLLEGYNIDANYDILYELGMISEILNNETIALKYYVQAMKITDSNESMENLSAIIDNLSYKISNDIINGKDNIEEFLSILDSFDLNIDKYLKNIVINKYPQKLIIETIRGCNLKCIFCPLQVDDNVKEHGLMSDETFEKILNDVVPMQKVKTFILHNLGEPLLDKTIFKKIAKIKKLRCDCEILIDSNLSVDFDAFEMVSSGLDILDVAFDGADQESYSKYRINGNLDKVIANVAKVATAKKMLNINKPSINTKTVLFKHITQQLDLISNISARCGADAYIMQTAIFRDETNENPKEWIPEQQELTRYDAKKLYNDNKLMFYKNNFEQEKSCSGILKDVPIVIDFKGNVYPCCYCCTHEEYNMGNINEKSFEEIWESDKYVEFRMEVLKNRFKYKICSKCYRPSNNS